MTQNLVKITSQAVAQISQPQKIELPKSLVLTTEEKAYIELYHNSKIFIEEIEFKGELMLSEIISKTATVAGFKKDGKDIDTEAQLMRVEIAEHFPNATIAEIETAFNTGVRKVYGEFIGLSIATYHGWLKAFFESETRKKSLKRYAEMKASDEAKELSEEEKLKIIADGYWADIEKMKSQQIVTPSVPAYEYCERIGVINLSNEEKIAFADKIRKQFESLVESSTDQDYKKYLKSVLADKKLLAIECKREAYLEHLKLFKITNKAI